MSNTVRILIAVLLVGIIALLCVIVGILAWRTFLQPEPTPTLTSPPPTSTLTPTTEAAVDDSWAKVQAAGKMLVGTSADYPPFEYYSSFFEIDGFDVALMNDIGRRLGVQVEYVDYAFDGLANGLQLGQLDAAIAAISVTSERQAYVDFSNVYLVSLGAALASDQTQVTVNRVEDLAGYRVGVQSGTIFQVTLQTALVDTGLTAPGNIFVYQRLDQAIEDLKNGQIDLVVMDLPAAEAAVQQGGFAIAGQGINPQNYSIALPKGSLALKIEIDRVLNDMQADGTIIQFARQYLNQDELPPTPTPAPTSTPGPPPSCLDNLALLEHPEGGSPEQPLVVQPGQTFTKAWRVQNTGTCTWDTSYKVVYVDGSDPASSMGGQPTPVEGLVAPGNVYDIRVNLVAPLRPGAYQGIWQMENSQSQGFGQRLPVTIEVPAPATATPAPTSTPSTDISFTVDRTQIKQGECVTFSWKVQNVREVYFYREGQNWQDHGVTGEESRVECPPVTTTYFLRVVKQDGSVEIPSITIRVEAVATAPQITRFTVDPPGQITQGQCVTIRWEVKGDVDRVNIGANGAPLWEGAPQSGKLDNCPPGTGTVAYGIEAVGPGGTSRQQQTINVVDPATATPEPTPAPEAPVIHAFAVDPNQIEAGGCVEVSWSVGGGASYARILRNGAVVLDNAPFTGQETDCLDQTGGYTYRLEAYNPTQESAGAERAVSVTEAAPDNPLAGTSWSATFYWDGSQMAQVLLGTALTAQFGAGGKLNGSAGCNTYSASYLVDGSFLSITPPSTSQKLCSDPEGIMEQENAFIGALTSAGSYSLDGGQLFISNSAGNVIVEFVSN